MPPKKSNIGRSTRHAQQVAASRAGETIEIRNARLETDRIRASTSRIAETPEERDSRIENLRVRASTSRAAETSQQHDVRVEDLRARASASRASATPEERDTRREAERSRQTRSRTKSISRKQRSITIKTMGPIPSWWRKSLVQRNFIMLTWVSNAGC